MSPKKRKLNVPDLSSLKLSDVVTVVQQHDDEEAALAAVREMLTIENVATWNVIAPKFDLDPNRGIAQLEKFEIPNAILPPLFHREVMTESLKWLDVYKERDAQVNKAARVRLMDAVRISSNP